VIYGIKRMAETLVFSVEHAAFITLGIVFATSFVIRQRRLAQPLINLKMFRIPALRASLGINLLGVFVVFGIFLPLAQYFQFVLGMQPLEAGLWTAPSGVAFVLGSVLTPLLAHRVRPAYVLSAGFTLSAIGLFVMSGALGDGNMVTLITGFVVFCVGIAPMGILTTDIVMSTAPPENAGEASGISETSFELGGALGIAMLGSLVTAIYRSAMVHAPEGYERYHEATETLGGAVAVAKTLPPQLGTPLLSSAQAAFTHAFGQATLLCAAMALVIAVIPLVFLRNQSVPR
jgi:DHA2 family multidrug resistance protein-like MFS transporter